MFVSRSNELAALESWWQRPGASMALVWGRRRVGKTALVGRFAEARRAVFHTARGVGVAEELDTFARKIPEGVDVGRRLDIAPLTSWEDALVTLAGAARHEPLLLVLDEYPDLAAGDPSIDTRLRAVWDEVRSSTQLKVLLCGSAVRAMEAVAEHRSPLHGRFDLRMLVHPFRPDEAALLLPGLSPADRARAWAICDGVPLYLSWWDQSSDVQGNLLRLACEPGAPLRTEGEFLLATDGASGGLTRQVLGAIAVGKNRHSEIVEAVTATRQVARVLDDLERLRLVERVIPVTDDGSTRTGRTTYRISDNYLAFWLAMLSPHLGEIDRGMGRAVARHLGQRLDDHLGPRYEEAFRMHLRRLAADGEFGPEAVKVGSFWTRGRDQVEIGAVVLAGLPATAVAVGECKWTERVAAPPLRALLARRAEALPRVADTPRHVIGARSAVTDPGDALVITAADIFA
ncbi:MAG: ATP-binding protein [Pseudonocardia sp.]|nr:ATP-binding protein [Pseudonocardia sp.]